MTNLLKLEPRRDSCRSPIESLLALPTITPDDELYFASGNNEYEDSISYFRQQIGNYLVQNAPFFSETILVPLVRELRLALIKARRERLWDYVHGQESDRGFARRTLEEYISITKSINLGCTRAKRTTTLKRAFKLLLPQAKNQLRSLEVSHVEIELGLNAAPRDGKPEELLEEFIAQRRLCGTGIENIMRSQLTVSRETRGR